MAVKNEFNEVNSLQILVLRENCDWLQGTFLKKSKHILVIQQNRKNFYKYYLLINICTIFNYNLCLFLWLHKIYMHHKIKPCLRVTLILMKVHVRIGMSEVFKFIHYF